MFSSKILFSLLLVHSFGWFQRVYTNSDTCSTDYFQEKNEEFNQMNHKQVLAAYVYNTNVTEENRQNMIETEAEVAKYFKTVIDDIKKCDYNSSRDETIRRQQLRIMSLLDFVFLPPEDYKELNAAVSAMQSNYATVKICEFKNTERCDLSLEPEVQEKIANSRDPEELKYYWKQWYDHAGTPVKSNFLKYVELTKKAIKLNGFNSLAESWISKYEDNNFEKSIDKIYDQILPFYKQIHAYVRHRLIEKYGSDVVSETGNIPIHLLGNLWGQTWEEIIDIITPFPQKPFINVTDQMLEQGYTPLKMFQLGDEFFQSLNMTKLPEAFWKESVLEKPKDGREIICHASAWDLFTIDDVRIKQCTQITMFSFYVVHHELGHIQYYLQYQKQPYAFRNGPNPGFHEAIGDFISLSVATPKHLQLIGLLKNFDSSDEEIRINEMFRKALKKIVFLPFSYTLDKYRWEVFRGNIEDNQLNCAFWKMRSRLSGLEPPIKRSKSDFDPPAKYHVSANVEYLRYFIAHIVQFQFHRAACIKSGQYVPGHSILTLDNCDIHGNVEVGNVFKEMLQLGSSKHWADALEILTGEREIDASALLEYFKPLQTWLEAENKKLGAHIGWDITEKCSG